MTSIEQYHPPEIMLGSLAKTYDLHIVRDGGFRYIGKIPTVLPDKLVPLGNARFLKELEAATEVAGVLTTPEIAERVPARFGVAVCDNPLETLYRIHADLCQGPHYWGVARPTVRGENVFVHPSACVADHNVMLGDNVRVEENAIVREYSVIGSGSLVGPGAVIGCEGFQTATLAGQKMLLPQSGGVRLGENVSILALATITRATFGGFTELGTDVVIDNLTQIAHDVIIGEGTRIAAGTVISGRVQIGANAYIAPNVTVSNGVKIGKKASVTLGSVVIDNVAENDTVTGNFAVRHMKFMKDMAKRFIL